MTETNMINLRRTIYLTIMNSVSPSPPLDSKSTFPFSC